MIAYFGYFLTTQSSKLKKVGLAILFSGEISLLPGKLPTHPSLNPTLTLTCHIRLNLEEGRWVASQRVPKIIIWL